ncbi:hypothetical protein EWM64_g4312 [Hericium alpestre]|uniref:PIG-P domain-containing protein n=1 Tax=Hericium alpestre TaxID=135208 RepID=A0A4Z0A1V8_9AGAM|nr:hypothetical protein EWM64_g4312 [Hericium alpestre]
MSDRSQPELPTSPTSPLAPYPPLPPPQYRSRAPEFYGFVAWSSTYLLFILYLLWVLLPDSIIIALGITWYPSREWALLVPAWTVVVVLLTYFTYFALAFYNTPPFDDIWTITDAKALHPDPDTPNPYHPRAIPELYDIPITLVNRVLYDRREGDQDGVAASQ